MLVAGSDSLTPAYGGSPQFLFHTITQTPPVTASIAQKICYSSLSLPLDTAATVHPMSVIMKSPKSSHQSTIQEHIYHTVQLLTSGNQRDFIHTNVESVRTIYISTLISAEHLSHSIYMFDSTILVGIHI